MIRKPTAIIATGACLASALVSGYGEQSEASVAAEAGITQEMPVPPARAEEHAPYFGVALWAALYEDNPKNLTLPPFPTSLVVDTVTRRSLSPLPSSEVTKAVTEPEAAVAPNVIPGRLYMLGDSLTQGMHSAGLQEKLSALGWEAMVRADCGRPLMGDETYTACDEGHPEAFTALYQIRQPEDEAYIATSEYIVIELGTNDYYRSKEEFLAKAKELIAEIRQINPYTKILWLDTYLGETKGDGYVGINQAIAEAIAQSGADAQAIRFADIAAPYYTCGDIHPCFPEGSKAMIDAITGALGVAATLGGSP